MSENKHTDKPIIDVCCGGKMFYIDKEKIYLLRMKHLI